MHLHHFFLLLYLACSCTAGPVVLGIADAVAAIVSEAAGAAIAGSSVAASCGVGVNAVWYGEFVVIDGALYAGTMAAPVAGGAVAGAGKLNVFAVMTSG